MRFFQTLEPQPDAPSVIAGLYGLREVSEQAGFWPCGVRLQYYWKIHGCGRNELVTSEESWRTFQRLEVWDIGGYETDVVLEPEDEGQSWDGMLQRRRKLQGPDDHVCCIDYGCD